MHRSDAAWTRYGEIDPYFGVVSHERFRRENLDAAAIAEFFQSGQRHLDWLVGTIRDRLGEELAPRRALDFGCGVGRLLIPLARLSQRVVGVDVSAGMLHEAARHCAEQAVGNVDLVRSDDRLSLVPGTFDFVHSWIVFQHIPPRRGMVVLREIVRRLEPGGLGALHVTHGSTAPRWQRVRAWLRSHGPGVNALVNIARGRRPGHPVMQMNAYDLNRIVALLQGAGCDRLHAHLTDHGGHLGAILVFRRPRNPEAGYQP
jgi:SAM-dependent methyltransferase